MIAGSRARAALFLALLSACSTGGAISGSSGSYRRAALHRIEPRPVPYDVEHYALDLDVDPVTRSLEGRCTIRLWPTVDEIDRVDLDFAGLEVASVRDGEGRELEHEHEGGLLSIQLARAARRGEYVSLTIAYGGQPKKGMWFARVARDGAPTQIFTHGECRDAHWWFPCYDEPHERATSEIRVTMPASWKSIAGGERIDRVVRGDRATESWRMTSPHPAYLETLVAGELAIETDAWNGVPLEFVCAPEYASAMRRAFADTDEILALFSELTGARYPYAKYAQCCVDGFPFGGMENASATTLIDTALSDERAFLDATPTGLVAHEAAHQWFGDLLTCKDWSQIWLNEGFATYFAALYTERAMGDEAFRREMRAMIDEYLARDVGSNRRPIVHAMARDPLELFFSGHVYGGAAVRLHHLRSVLGDDAFFDGVRAYVGEHRDRAVESADFEKSMSTAAGTDLRWFFEQWFEKPGFPEVRSSWTWDEDARRATLSIEQMQATGSPTPAVFRIPVDVEIAWGNERRVERIVIDRREQEFTFEVASKPAWVRLDPYCSVPMQSDERRAVREWIAIGETCADAVARAHAVRVIAREMRATESEAVKDELARVLLERVQGDSSTHVRAAAARGLDGIGTPLVREVLVTVVRDDLDRTVRAAALDCLRAFAPDPELAALALREYERDGESWNLAGAAASLYARAAPEKAWDWLVAELATPSWHGAWQARLLAEISALGDPRSKALFLSIAADANQPDGARMVAVRELGRMGRGDSEVRAALVALLSTDRFRLRREAIVALGYLRDPGARAPLERHWSTTVHESEKRAVEGALENLAGGM